MGMKGDAGGSRGRGGQGGLSVALIRQVVRRGSNAPHHLQPEAPYRGMRGIGAYSPSSLTALWNPSLYRVRGSRSGDKGG